MGLRVSVLHDPIIGDCTNGGITAHVDEIVIVNVDGPTLPDGARLPAAMLVSNGRAGARIVPAVLDENGAWVERGGWAMFGGNYAASLDARFQDKVREITGHRGQCAVAVHDRYEAHMPRY